MSTGNTLGYRMGSAAAGPVERPSLWPIETLRSAFAREFTEWSDTQLFHLCQERRERCIIIIVVVVVVVNGGASFT